MEARFTNKGPFHNTQFTEVSECKHGIIATDLSIFSPHFWTILIHLIAIQRGKEKGWNTVYDNTKSWFAFPRLIHRPWRIFFILCINQQRLHYGNKFDEVLLPHCKTTQESALQPEKLAPWQNINSNWCAISGARKHQSLLSYRLFHCHEMLTTSNESQWVAMTTAFDRENQAWHPGKTMLHQEGTACSPQPSATKAPSTLHNHGLC